jgi:hypothetical protein
MQGKYLFEETKRTVMTDLALNEKSRPSSVDILSPFIFFALFGGLFFGPIGASIGGVLGAAIGGIVGSRESGTVSGDP